MSWQWLILVIATMMATLIFGCSRPSGELQGISEDVLKAKRGISIEIRPLDKQN